MKQITINGETLTPINGSRAHYDLYYFHGVLLDEIPRKQTVKSYVKTSRDEYVGILSRAYSSRNIKIAIILVPLFLISTAGVIFLTNRDHKQAIDTKIDLSDVSVKSNLIILKYRKFLSYVNGSVDICLVNGNKPATISITGKGITADEYSLKENEELYYYPLTLESERAIVSAKLHYRVEGEDTERTYSVTIENPEDQKLNTNSDVNLDDEEVIIE